MNADAIAARWLRGFRPPRQVDVVEWIEANVRLPEVGASRGAKWRRDAVPYVPGILTACADRSTRRVVVRKGAQQGLTTAFLGLVGFFLVHRPTPLLWVAPTTKQVTEFAKGPVADLLRRTPDLAGVVNAPRKRGEPGSSLLTKLAPGGGVAYFAGGNSPNSFAALSVRVAIMDDCDRVPAVVSEEGDPVHLLTARTTAWPDALCIFLSTPVLAAGRVETLYRDTDRRRYFVTCPRCRAAAPTTFSEDGSSWWVRFNDRDPGTARLCCPKCKHEVGERDRMALMRGGEWRPTADPVVAGHVGFEVISPMSPFVSLETLTEKFLVANAAGPRALREWLALHMASGWRDPSQVGLDEAALLDRMEASYV